MPIYQYSTTPLYASDGQTVQFRYEAPANFADIQQVIIEIGDIVTFWVIETIPEDDAPTPFDLKAIDPADIHDPPNNPAIYTYAETAAGPDAAPTGGGGGAPVRLGETVITVSGLSDTTQVNLIISSNGLVADDWAWRVRNWNGTSYDAWPAFTTGSNWPSPVPLVKNEDQVQVRTASTPFAADKRELTVQIGSGSAVWELSTGSLPVNTPTPAPQFQSLNNLNLGEIVYSNVVQIAGLTSSTAVVSVLPGTGSFAISNSNATTTNADNFEVLTGVSFGTTGTISNGQFLQLKGVASSSSNSLVNYGVSIGDGINISAWLIETGVGVDLLVDTFTFTDLVEQVPGTQNILSEVETISGLTPGITVPVTVNSFSPPEALPRIKLNGGSTGPISNIFVGNNSTIQLVMNAHPDLPIAPGTKSSSVSISVGNKVINSWDISNWYGPDETPSFVDPADAINQTPGGTGVLGPVLLENFNVPIQVSITNPIAYDEFDVATGEAVNPILVSIDGGVIQTLPATIPNNPTGQPVSVVFFTDQPGNANVDPVQALSHYLEFDITFGLAPATTVKVFNYAVKPTPPAYVSQWYTNKNDKFDQEAYEAAGSPVANAADYYNASKFDGLTIGTVVAVPKETIAGYGNLESRYPGFLECNGQQLFAADYPWLWDSIGNSYGGDGAYNDVSKAYTGQFTIPDYRNKRLTGRGIVDSSRGASAFLEATNSGGSYDIVGSTGGYWYVSDVGVAGPDPLEQVFTTPGSNQGTESPFYVLGTPKTYGLSELTGEVSFTVTGSVNATIGPVREQRIGVPPHDHFFITGQPENASGDPVIPWGVWAYYRTQSDNGANSDSTGDRESGEKSDEPSSDAVYSEWKQLNELNASQFNQALADTNGGSLEDELPLGPEGSNSTSTFGNYWGSPSSGLPNQNGLFRKAGTLTDAGVIDTKEAKARIDQYTSPTAEATHAHQLGTFEITDQATDYTYGNGNAFGGFTQGLASFGANTEVVFNQSDVQIELNDANFNWSNSSKPIPSVALDPQKKVPILAPFHKMKYIIKAY